MIGRIALCALIALPVCAQHEKIERTCQPAHGLAYHHGPSAGRIFPPGHGRRSF